MSILVIVNPIG